MRIVELTSNLADDAGDLADAHALSGFDAVHLASALLVAEHDPIVRHMGFTPARSRAVSRLMTLPNALWPPDD